jgi:hypothetical protein
MRGASSCPASILILHGASHVAISLKHLEGLLDSIGWKYQSRPKEGSDTEGFLQSGFPAQTYKDKDGDLYINVIFSVEENGELVKVIVPRLYNCIDRHYRKAFFEVAIRKTFEKKLCFFDYDHRDGEIRMIIDLPIEDNTLTAAQVQRVVRTLVRLIDTNDPDLRAAVEEGRLPLIDYKSDLSAEIANMSPDEQLELLVQIKQRKAGN